MAFSIPDPKTWRPSKDEWYPRLYVGQHWQDRSIPLYFSIDGWGVKYSLDRPVIPKWSVCPLGDPCRGKPLWVTFQDVMKHMSGDAVRTCWDDGIKTDLESASLAALRNKYLAQSSFEPDAPVYNELLLAKLVMKEPTKPVVKDQASLTKNIVDLSKENVEEKSPAIPKPKRPTSVTGAEQEVEIVSFKRRKTQGIRGSTK